MASGCHGFHNMLVCTPFETWTVFVLLSSAKLRKLLLAVAGGVSLAVQNFAACIISSTLGSMTMSPPLLKIWSGYQ